MRVVLTILLLLVAPGWLPAAGEPVPAPDRERAGTMLGSLLLADLDARALRLAPGPLALAGPGREDPLVRGLARRLSRRGFSLVTGGGPLPADRPRLSLEEHSRALVELRAPGLGAGSWQVHIEDRPWVGRPGEAGWIHCRGSWELSREEALRQGRKELGLEAGRALAAPLPWRPWREKAIEPLVRQLMAQSEHFLELERTGSGDLWCARLRAPLTGAAFRGAEVALERADRARFLRLGLAFLAALAAWGLAHRLDWWTRGYYTNRIRFSLFVAWLGLSCLVGGAL